MPRSRTLYTRAVLWLIASLATPLLAQPVATSFESPAEALSADARETAGLLGVSVAEALRRLEAQEASVPLVDRLAQSYRDRLAGVVVEQRPDFRIVLFVTGAPGPDLQVATAPFGVPVVVRPGARATRDAVLDAIRLHQAELRAALPSPPGMGLDPRTGALLVVVRAGALDGEGDEAATTARLEAIAGVPVEVRQWGDFDADLAVEGGGRVVGGDAEEARRFVCTSGFVVTDGARSALSTAAHCPDDLRFVDRDRTETPLALLGAWGAGTQDVQLHDAGQPLSPAFRAADEGRARLVTTWRNRASTRAGDIVCHRGIRTGYSCAEVRFPDYAPPGDLCAGPCPATWVAVAGPKCRGGDSGGPVFVGQVAFGLLKGESSDNGACRLYYYMSVDYLPPGWTPAVVSAPPPVATSGTATPSAAPPG